MQITLINCNTHLIAQGINMNAIGSGNLMNNAVCAKIPSYQSWEYDFYNDKVIITCPDGTTIPDMSGFGELVV